MQKPLKALPDSATNAVSVRQYILIGVAQPSVGVSRRKQVTASLGLADLPMQHIPEYSGLNVCSLANGSGERTFSPSSLKAVSPSSFS
jgi:hypothetical protein